MPALALPRLRLEGRVLEVDATRLGFTAPEAATLLGAHGVQLTEDDLLVLLERTEGWAAGLRLAAMSLANADDPSALIANFASNDRAVADYLVGEVLARQEEPVRQFLLTTSVSERITADLARELSGREDAGAVLDQLERSNSFIVRLGRHGGWYRYHPMLREYLRAELARQNHEQLGTLHGTAARWFAARHETMTAIEHAVEGNDAGLTAGLLEGSGLQHVLDGHGVRLRRVLSQATEEVARRPGVALVIAATALEAGDLAAADAALATMEPSCDVPAAPPRLSGLDTAIALQRARIDGERTVAREVLARSAASAGDVDIDLLTLLHRGATWIWLHDLDAAERDLRRALVMARATGRDWVAMQCLGRLSTVACARMDMTATGRAANEALALATGHGWTRTQPHAAASLALGWVAYQRLDDPTVTALRPAVRLLRESGDPSSGLAVALFEVTAAFDETEDRHALVAELREEWQRAPAGCLPPSLVAGAATIEHRMALHVGEPTWAAEVTERTGRLLGDTGEFRVLQAVGQAHRGRCEAARRLLGPVLTDQLTCVAPLTRIEAWIWEGRLAHRANDGPRAHAAVVEALTIGASHELMRPFVAGGQELHDLLARGAGRFGRREAFAARVRMAIAPSDQESLESLTTRELQLLVELPSLRTTEEIAASMFVSVNTVKTHLRGIYRKLGVNSRREAIVLARRRGLL
jgi:LuxR family maltose regulon positive regulatory protein